MSHSLREYKDDLGRIAEQLAHSDIDLEILATAHRHGKQDGDIYRDLKAAYPIQWHAARGADQRGALDGGIEGLIATFGVTEADVAGIRETDYLYKQVIPRGHLVAVVGDYNLLCPDIKVGENNAHMHEAIPGVHIPAAKTMQWGKK
jgi:hypothetical protein